MLLELQISINDLLLSYHKAIEEIKNNYKSTKIGEIIKANVKNLNNIKMKINKLLDEDEDEDEVDKVEGEGEDEGDKGEVDNKVEVDKVNKVEEELEKGKIQKLINEAEEFIKERLSFIDEILKE